MQTEKVRRKKSNFRYYIRWISFLHYPKGKSFKPKHLRQSRVKWGINRTTIHITDTNTTSHTRQSKFNFSTSLIISRTRVGAMIVRTTWRWHPHAWPLLIKDSNVIKCSSMASFSHSSGPGHWNSFTILWVTRLSVCSLFLAPHNTFLPVHFQFRGVISW